MQAIQVKVLPATNFKGTRVKAWSYSGQSVTQSWNYELSGSGNQAECAYNLALKLEWNVKMIGGSLPNGDYAFVIVESNCQLEVKS